MNDKEARLFAEKVDVFLHRLEPAERELMSRILRVATREWLAEEGRRQVDDAGSVQSPGDDPKPTSKD